MARARSVSLACGTNLIAKASNTSPTGVISDIAVQKFFLNSLSDGAMRLLITKDNGVELCLGLAQEFFKAVAYVFRDAWEEQTPKTSRLVHGAGIVAMGYVMDLLHRSDGARTWQDFAAGMSCLVDKVAFKPLRPGRYGGHRRCAQREIGQKSKIGRC